MVKCGRGGVSMEYNGSPSGERSKVDVGSLLTKQSRIAIREERTVRLNRLVENDCSIGNIRPV